MALKQTHAAAICISFLNTLKNQNHLHSVPKPSFPPLIRTTHFYAVPATNLSKWLIIIETNQTKTKQQQHTKPLVLRNLHVFDCQNDGRERSLHSKEKTTPISHIAQNAPNNMKMDKILHLGCRF